MKCSLKTAFLTHVKILAFNSQKPSIYYGGPQRQHTNINFITAI